ncbi:MAG: phospho-sugar mutase [Ruminococcaceae bacterium]|nr:phospho-sugar mutase [Oscillospiraceae bacterium]
MEENVKSLYEKWKIATENDKELSVDLSGLTEEEIFDRFYRELDFGTAGLRGVLGAGTNRMNIYTVARASTGVAKCIVGNKKKVCSVAIAYDSRNNSELFAKTAAAVYAANGMHVYIYPELMPTPALSYAVRNLQCDAGVVITASHNPAKYNGYKVYGDDGCQITETVAAQILERIKETPYFEEIPSFEILLGEGKIEYISKALTEAYIADAVACARAAREGDRALKVVYTPLNGAGMRCVTEALAKCGFRDITVVPEQEKPDGNFPTCPYPNPEIKEALALGLDLMQETGADLLLATDPDCDRVGTAVPMGDSYRLISGNEMGILLLDYICREKSLQGSMPKEPMAVKTVVSTDMTYEVAKKYGVRIVDVLTGFKYIGEQIALLEEAGKEENYLFGFEESYGYLCSGFVRDKDGVSTSVLICEMAAFYKSQGKTLGDRMNELYTEFGTYRNFVDNFAFEGSVGMEKMLGIMTSLREDPPKAVLGHRLIAVNDYLKSESVSLETGAREKIDLPKSNVLKFVYDGGLGIIARPSGTEPKLKIYYTVKADSDALAEELVQSLAGKGGAFASLVIS